MDKAELSKEKISLNLKIQSTWYENSLTLYFYFITILQTLLIHDCWYSLLSICSKDSWESLGNMPVERDYHGCVVMSNSDNVLLVGSYDSGEL